MTVGRICQPRWRRQVPRELFDMLGATGALGLPYPEVIGRQLLGEDR